MRTELQAKPAGHETDFVGAWKLRRETIGAGLSGRDDLYRDPDDGRLWELTWPQSDMHGGGPHRLSCLTIDAARMKYGAVVDS